MKCVKKDNFKNIIGDIKEMEKKEKKNTPKQPPKLLSAARVVQPDTCRIQIFRYWH